MEGEDCRGAFMGKEISLNEIEKVIDEKVRPELALHGGNILIEEYSEGVLKVRLTGECSNCPSAGLTMENIVESNLNEVFPDLKIELCTGVSDELIEMAKSILRRKHEGRS